MKISEQKIIAQPIEVVFDWINDIDAYQHEVPWCVSSGILSQTSSEHLRGFLEMQVGPFRRRIITDNTLSAPHKITMTLVEGPFSFFEGQWQLEEIDTTHTQVCLFIDVRWSEPWLESLVELSYNHLRVEALHYLEQALLHRKRV